MVIFGNYIYILKKIIGNFVPQKQGITCQHWYVPMLIKYGVLDFTLMMPT
jgi:hypothetical protein